MPVTEPSIAAVKRTPSSTELYSPEFATAGVSPGANSAQGQL